MDSQSGRFMTVDLQSPVYVNPQTLNQYIYALDNPNRYTDPTGAVANEIPTHAELEQWKEDAEEDASDRWGAGKERYLQLLKALGLYDSWLATNNPTISFSTGPSQFATTTYYFTQLTTTTTATSQVTTTTQQTTITTAIPTTSPYPSQVSPSTTTTVTQQTLSCTATPNLTSVGLTVAMIAVDVIVGIAQPELGPFLSPLVAAEFTALGLELSSGSCG